MLNKCLDQTADCADWSERMFKGMHHIGLETRQLLYRGGEGFEIPVTLNDFVTKVLAMSFWGGGGI